jgi:hypothetical protein
MSVDVQQGSYEWLMARVGHVTGSKFRSVLSRLKTGAPSQERKDYLTDITIERLTGQPTQHFVNSAMAWGTEQEPHARNAYLRRTNYRVDQVGFIKHPELMVGVSPDGIIEMGEGILEIKAPTSATHLRTLEEGMDPVHQAQIQGAMWITGATFADFVSYDPRMPEGLELYVQRVSRDQDFIDRLKNEVNVFLAEVDEKIVTLKEISNVRR